MTSESLLDRMLFLSGLRIESFFDFLGGLIKELTPFLPIFWVELFLISARSLLILDEFISDKIINYIKS